MNSYGAVLKIDQEQRMVYGWASVIEENGQPVVDSQGDIIREPVLVKAAQQFMLDARAGKVMHQGNQVADIVESVVMTKDVQKALGIDLGKVGWFIGMKVAEGSNELWDQVKNGEFPMFSIGGKGRRKNVEA